MDERINPTVSLGPAVLSLIHDIRTPLVAIKSTLNCTKKVFNTLIQTYEIACRHGLAEQVFDIGFLKRLSDLFDHSIDETLLTHYYLNKIQDIFLLII